MTKLKIESKLPVKTIRHRQVETITSLSRKTICLPLHFFFTSSLIVICPILASKIRQRNNQYDDDTSEIYTDAWPT